MKNSNYDKKFNCRACYDEGDKIVKEYFVIYALNKKLAIEEAKNRHPCAWYYEAELITI